MNNCARKVFTGQVYRVEANRNGNFTPALIRAHSEEEAKAAFLRMWPDAIVSSIREEK